MLSSLQNLSAQIHIFWREIFEICVFVYQIQVKKGFRFAPVMKQRLLCVRPKAGDMTFPGNCKKISTFPKELYESFKTIPMVPSEL